MGESSRRFPMPKVFIKTYGCQMNERDSEQVSQMLAERGYECGSFRTAFGSDPAAEPG